MQDDAKDDTQGDELAGIVGPTDIPDEVIAQVTRFKEDFDNQVWRLNNLYKIKDKAGKIVDFVMNDAQEYLYYAQWFRNVILKARQLGFTTMIDLLFLDTCIFNNNVRAGIIAHNKEDAEAFFEEKIVFPYENLHPAIRGHVKATTNRVGELEFSNGSKISVSSSFRSGTLQLLHVSELGKIAVTRPDKAKEIRTGAFEAVDQGQKIFVESTAEGQDGDFFEMCDKAQKLVQESKKLTKLDFKFHFFPWWKNPKYRLDTSGVVFKAEDIKYFKDLLQRNIILDENQMAWYIKKKESLRDDMFREYPSYPEEAFKASIEGAYYGNEMAVLRAKGRIGSVPHEPGFPVHTMWDLGMDNFNYIVFFQEIVREIRFIDCLYNSGVGFPWYAREMAKKPYMYGSHYLPHDVRVKELGTGEKRKDTLVKLGVRPIVEVNRPKNQDQFNDQIEEVRMFLSRAWIDEQNCAHLIKSLDQYRHEWDESLGRFKNIALGNWASHGADAVRTGAVGYNSVLIQDGSGLEPPPTEDF